MIRTTSTVLDDNAAEFAAVAALVTEVGNLDGSLDLIDQLVIKQQTKTTGITINKATVLEQMIEKALKVAGALKAFASSTGDNELFAKADITRNSFMTVRDQLRDDIAQEMHDLSDANLAALAPFGVTAATLTALQTRIDAYDEIVVGPQSAKAKKTTVTAMLGAEIDRSMMLLNDRVDPLMMQFQGSGHDLLRRLHKRPDHHRQQRRRRRAPPARPTRAVVLEINCLLAARRRRRAEQARLRIGSQRTVLHPRSRFRRAALQPPAHDALHGIVARSRIGNCRRPRQRRDGILRADGRAVTAHRLIARRARQTAEPFGRSRRIFLRPHVDRRIECIGTDIRRQIRGPLGTGFRVGPRDLTRDD